MKIIIVIMTTTTRRINNNKAIKHMSIEVTTIEFYSTVYDY